MKMTIGVLGLAMLPFCADAEFQNDVRIPMRDGVYPDGLMLLVR